MKYYFAVIFLVSMMFVVPVQQSYGLISGVSEYFDESPNLYRIGSGAKEFVEDPKNESPCTNPTFEIKDTDLQLDPIKKLAATEGNFFMFLNEHGTDSYRYLKVLMPEGEGQPRYYGFVYDENNMQVGGYGYGLDSGSLVAGIETFEKDAVIDEDKGSTDFMEGRSQFGLPDAVKQGDYRANVVLYHYDQPRTDKKTCTMVIDWEFSVNDKGEFSTGAVQTRTGTLVDITAELSPRQQLELGMETFSIQCKEGYQKLSQKFHLFYDGRTACVSSETREKLIERGWDLAKPKSELTYFEKFQEMEIGQRYANFMQKQDYNNVPNAFVIGKYNFNGDETITYFCGEFKDITVNHNRFFNGAIDDSGNIKWDGTKDLSSWCAISDSAHKFSFVYHWQEG